mgnify:CR=1 FL=1
MAIPWAYFVPNQVLKIKTTFIQWLALFFFNRIEWLLVVECTTVKNADIAKVFWPKRKNVLFCCRTLSFVLQWDLDQRCEARFNTFLAGAGIAADSHPHFKSIETWIKLRTLLRTCRWALPAGVRYADYHCWEFEIPPIFRSTAAFPSSEIRWLKNHGCRNSDECIAEVLVKLNKNNALSPILRTLAAGTTPA